MKIGRRSFVIVAVALAGTAAVAATTLGLRRSAHHEPDPGPRIHAHFDHTPVLQEPFAQPQDVTRTCLSCHPKAATEIMATAHWRWLGSEVTVPGHAGTTRIGKKNLINNFCISIAGNEASCTKCHAGYGWADTTFDFTKQDCLVCHERSGSYAKGSAGMPAKDVDLLAVARTVGYPTRENCGGCHNYGGGGQGVKHGDLDNTLLNPYPDDDVHMGREKLLCIDCHAGPAHNIRGRAFSVSVEDQNGVDCSDCHVGHQHHDERIDRHVSAVACQSCHIPTYAKRLPTKTFWDWSKAGDKNRADDEHHYLKIKGEFVYDQDIVPEYYWFNRSMNRYLIGDHLDPTKVTNINQPRGDIRDKTARIWPFKVHRALQHYDADNLVLLPPVTGGKGGYWTEFDWDKALRLDSEALGLAYSGKFGFTRTQMFWPLSHMVTPKEQALTCSDCHGPNGRLSWESLGYAGDPITTGGRR